MNHHFFWVAAATSARTIYQERFSNSNLRGKLATKIEAKCDRQSNNTHALIQCMAAADVVVNLLSKCTIEGGVSWHDCKKHSFVGELHTHKHVNLLYYENWVEQQMYDKYTLHTDG